MEVVGKICGIILAFCALGNAISDKTPVMIWADHDLDEIPTLRGGHSLSSESFQQDYLSKLLPQVKQNFLIFLQDKLSLNDIVNHADVYNPESSGSAFHNLKQLLEERPSVSIPSVHSANNALLSHVQSLSGVAKHDLHEPYDLSQISLHEDSLNVVTVHLPSSRSEDRETSLAAIDSIIGLVTSAAKNLQAPFTALYTAQQPFQEAALQPGRHLLQTGVDGEGGPFYVNTSCVLFYANSITLHPYNITIDNTTTLTKTETCANQTAQLTMNWSVDGHTLELGMDFAYRLGYWYVLNWYGKFDNNNLEGMQSNLSVYDSASLASPKYFSYHCFNGPQIMAKNNTVDVVIKDMQVQALFFKREARFGRPNDCVGFFTIAIWSWIIVVLLLLTILAFGITMVANISTMDRFDDPKGKTISVNAGD